MYADISEMTCGVNVTQYIVWRNMTLEEIFGANIRAYPCSIWQPNTLRFCTYPKHITPERETCDRDVGSKLPTRNLLLCKIDIQFYIPVICFFSLHVTISNVYNLYKTGGGQMNIMYSAQYGNIRRSAGDLRC